MLHSTHWVSSSLLRGEYGTKLVSRCLRVVVSIFYRSFTTLFMIEHDCDDTVNSCVCLEPSTYN